MNRKQQRLFRYAVDLFIQTLEQVQKRKINYKCNNADTAAWENFIKIYGNTIGEDFVTKFIQYGIQSWFNDSVEGDKSKSIRFTWVIGAPAIKRWNAFDIKTNVAITRKNLKTNFNIKNTVRSNDTQLPALINSVRNVEEKFKEEYYNTNRGKLWCIANTTLYFHKSSKCVNCKFKTDCKELLRKEYPRIYKNRGYGE